MVMNEDDDSFIDKMIDEGKREYEQAKKSLKKLAGKKDLKRQKLPKRKSSFGDRDKLSPIPDPGC